MKKAKNQQYAAFETPEPKKKRGKLYALLALCSAFVMSLVMVGATANAEEIINGDMRNFDGWRRVTIDAIKDINSSFEFEKGAAIALGYADTNRIGYKLKCSDPSLVETDGKSRYTYMITLLRRNAPRNKTSIYQNDDNYQTRDIVEQAAYTVIYDASKGVGAKAEKENVYRYSDGNIQSGTPFTETVEMNTLDNGLPLMAWGATDPDVFGARWWVDTASPDVEYAIMMIFTKSHIEQEKKTSGSLWWKKTWYEDKEVTDVLQGAVSDFRSYYGIAKGIEDAGDLPKYANSAAYANIERVLGRAVEKVKVRYLKNIQDTTNTKNPKPTPFCELVTEEVTVRINDKKAGVISAEQVASALNVQGFNVMLSACGDFEYNTTTKTYDANYNGKSVYVKSFTVDGKTNDYFFGLESYRDYYSDLISKGVITRDVYDYCFNKSTTPYSQALSGKTDDELYAYWAYIPIPKTYTFNRAYKELFSTDKTFDGVVRNYGYEGEVDYGKYVQYLKEYGYSGFATFWNTWFAAAESTLSGKEKVPCEHNLLLADGTTSVAFISDNGAESTTDDKPLIVNDATKKAQETLNKMIDAAKDAAGGLSQGVASFLNQIKGLIIMAIIAVVAIALIKTLPELGKNKKR